MTINYILPENRLNILQQSELIFIPSFLLFTEPISILILSHYTISFISIYSSQSNIFP